MGGLPHAAASSVALGGVASRCMFLCLTLPHQCSCCKVLQILGTCKNLPRRAPCGSFQHGFVHQPLAPLFHRMVVLLTAASGIATNGVNCAGVAVQTRLSFRSGMRLVGQPGEVTRSTAALPRLRGGLWYISLNLGCMN